MAGPRPGGEEGAVTSEDESQALADAEEALTQKRYERLQALLDTFEEPIRRADAMSRLEAWLILHPPHLSGE
jgi:hypothetical protein